MCKVHHGALQREELAEQQPEIGCAKTFRHFYDADPFQRHEEFHLAR